MASDIPTGDYLTGYCRRQIMLSPRKFGYVGSFSREALEVAVDQDMMFDHMLMRLTTQILSGRTFSSSPRVAIDYPSSWWQYFKHSLDGWVSDKDELWNGRSKDETPVTPPPWIFLLWPLLVLWPRFLKRHPVKYSKLDAEIEFNQDILYPECDAPVQAGRPVIYEEMTMIPFWEPDQDKWPAYLKNDPGRFLNRHEIASEIYRDPEGQHYGVAFGPDQTLNWLERNGVNVDQLVKRQ